MHNIHTHVWDTALHFDAQTIRESDLSRGYPLDLSVKHDEFIEDMVPFSRVAVFGLKARLCGYWVPDTYVADFVAKDPHKLVGFASCDPTQPSAMEELKFAIESLHLRGLKMGPVYAGFDPREDRCMPVYQYCEKNGIPIIVHTGTTFNRLAHLEHSLPRHFDEVAQKFPGLTIIMAHMGHPWCEECCVTIRKHPRLYADISALYYRPWQFYNALVSAQEYKVTNKLLFGTDYPFTRSVDSIEGLRTVNRLVEGTHLPIISRQVIDTILEQDAFSLIGIGASS